MEGEMKGEIYHFFQANLCIFISLTYSFFITRSTDGGLTRLLLLLPVIILFLLLPLNFNSVHFAGGFAFSFSWLVNFKLLLLAFNGGPWSSARSISFLQFLVICSPVRISKIRPESDLRRVIGAKFVVNCFLLCALICVVLFDLIPNQNRNLVLLAYCLFVYFLLETGLTLIAATVGAVAGASPEAPFNAPHRSTSLQNFWGKRWNLVASDSLRQTVYEPCRKLFSVFMNRESAPLPAVFATFVVSGLMHELMYFYLGRVWPTWEVTWFFVVNGLCVTAEMKVKKALAGKFWLPEFIAGPLTVGFVVITSFWLFFPQFIRSGSDARMFGEYASVSAWLKYVTLWLIKDTGRSNEL